MMPKHQEMEAPLLKCLEETGGKAKPSEIYIHMGRFFPNLTELDLKETLASGGNKWTNRIQWVRQRLVSAGEMESPEYGVWAITDKGRRRLADLAAREMPHEPQAPKEPEPANFEELAEDYLEAFKQKVIQKLQDLLPAQFERFAGELLRAYGFFEVKVTGRAGDGGIDGHGGLKVGLTKMNVAFQCKKWQGQVPKPEIDKFRGAIQGEFEHGIFFTTSDFSSPARDASTKKGAVPIVLVNGDAIVQLMIDKQFGVKRRPVEIYEDQIEAVFEET